MAREVIYEASTERFQILNKDGLIDSDIPLRLTDERIVEMYKKMMWARLFDEKALKLQRQGRMGTWASLRGQEASQIGMATAMEDGDWLVPSFREHALMLARGVPAHAIYTYWRGDERASVSPEAPRVLPPSIPVGSQLIHGAGLGFGLKLRGESSVVVACAGDGATSEGDFHEALNFAGVFESRTVFFIQNNGYAISLPVKRQTAALSLAQKAHAYGMPGVQVDGNDPLAVHEASAEALSRARRGEGPTLIEAVTYRLGDHTTSDAASRYRSEEEVAHWAKRDPIVRTAKYLESRGLWNKELEESWISEVRGFVEEAVEKMEKTKPAAPKEILENMFATMPWNLLEQRKALIDEAGNG